MMKIIADENIPLVHEFFSTLGEVCTRVGRAITAADVKDADVLLVRSVTDVNAALLTGSRVRFVGTCTIGVDHLDRDYLEGQGIAYASAPGCNANSVVEYVLSVLSALDEGWLTKTVGIVGCGNVGGLLYRRLRSLGVRCRCYDPFLNNADIDALTDLDSVLAADIVSLHTPLTLSGPHPTYHMFGRDRLLALAPDSLLINTGRGPVIDNTALLEVLQQRDLMRVVLDVWEPEPDLNPRLLRRVALGTAHIAGYSYDGKVAGTAMIYRALCDFLQKPAHVSVAEPLGMEHRQALGIAGDTPVALARHAILQAYDVRVDDRELRAAAAGPVPLPQAFDHLRKCYRQRREFSRYQLTMPSGGIPESALDLLRKLGFSV